MKRILFVCLMLASVKIQARERPFFQASRALSMGDAFTAYDVGFEAVYYNPAGVAKRYKPRIKLLDIEATASQTLVGTFSNSFSSLTNITKILSLIQDTAGKVQSIGVTLTPQFLVRNFSLGLVARSYAEGYLDPTSGGMDLYMTTDLALQAHFGVALLSGIIKLGVGVKALNRAEIDKPYSAAPSESTVTSAWKEGTGFGFDAGALIQLPVFLIPTFGVAIHEIGGTSLLERRLLFSGSVGAGAPSDLRQRVDLGFALHGKYGRGVKSGFDIDYKDILNRSSSTMSRVNAGIEFSFSEFFFIRAGYSAFKYWSAGMGLHAPGAGLELSTYGEDVAFRAASIQRDRKWVVRYVSSF